MIIVIHKASVIVKFQYFLFKNLQNIQHSIQKMDMF